MRPFTLNRASPLADGLVFWWTALADLRTDLMGSTGNPTFGATGPPSLSDVEGIPAYDFQEANYYHIKFPKSPSWTGLGNITLSVRGSWTPTLSSTYSQLTAGQSDWGGVFDERSFRLRVEGTAPTVVWEISDDGNDPDGSCTWNASSIYSANGAVHFVGTYFGVGAGTSIEKLYIDGLLRDTSTIADGPTAYASPTIGLSIGGHWDTDESGSKYRGKIWEVAIWNRTFSAKDVGYLYHHPFDLYHPVYAVKSISDPTITAPSYLWPFSDDFTGTNNDPWDTDKWLTSTS